MSGVANENLEKLKCFLYRTYIWSAQNITQFPIREILSAPNISKIAINLICSKNQENYLKMKKGQHKLENSYICDFSRFFFSKWQSEAAEHMKDLIEHVKDFH